MAPRFWSAVISVAVMCQMAWSTVVIADIDRNDNVQKQSKANNTWSGIMLAQADYESSSDEESPSLPSPGVIPPPDVIPPSNETAEPEKEVTLEPTSTPITTQVQPPSQEVPAKVEREAEIQPDEGKKQPTVQKKKEEPAKHTQTGVSWEISANSVTVDGKQWTRFSISPDIPIWKFGVGLDIECFIDNEGQFSTKGWDFKDNWKESLYRKLRYIRFGYENDPVFAKVGGLNGVTFGYGFIVDRFTNLLHYPDDKLIGVQVYLNDVGPIGLTLQTMAPDIIEFNHEGGIFAGRLAVRPLKQMNLPLLSSLSVGATYAMDINQYAPAHSWEYEGHLWDKNDNGKVDWDWANAAAHNAEDSAHVRWDAANGIVDGADVPYVMPDQVYRDSTRRYAILGFDVGIPIIKNSPLGINMDIYAQAGVVADSNMFSKQTGWGFGAPGVRLMAGPFIAQLEYRHVKGKFTPSYFNTYYLDERLIRHPYPPTVKSDGLPEVNLDGIFGSASFNLFNLFVAEAGYQVMVGKDDNLDQRFEVRGQIGDEVLSKIPKVNKAEIYFYKTNINRTVVVYTNKGNVFLSRKTGEPVYDEFFEQTPNLFWGYRIGVEIAEGATLLWDTRYGYQWNSSYRLVPYNNISVGTVLSF